MAVPQGLGTAAAPPPSRADAAGRVPLTWSRMRYPQSLYKYVALLGSLAFIAFSLEYLNIEVDRLPGMLGRMGEMLARRYFPPNLGHILNADYWHSVVETLQMSYLATVLGLAAAIPLAWFAAYNMTPSRRFLYPVARLFIMGCRSVHEMIWTILLVTLLGFGMLPGALALTLFCIGFAGKLFSEAIEAIEPGQVEAIRSAGANNLQVFVFAVLPQVRVAWTGISIYTWDVVFRAATVVGFFGAGGMGWYLRESVQRVASRDVAAILLSIIVVVIISELVSAWLRTRIARAVA
ncbi:MAG TPA: phosphonate ABC transporter, permease protein PhnE [Caldimonas sp.]|jgi:phosphonate transport system permease protein|nr:phosphonate ABC transporter, permease protein PhnE [Caldimonas sp.]HEX2540258.1 phosphonate ABC transporter, permease protein PhnE [Caldimonas sp.]